LGCYPFFWWLIFFYVHYFFFEIFYVHYLSFYNTPTLWLRVLWGTRFTTRDSRYAYNSRSHDQYVVSPHNRADIKVTSSITVPDIKSYNWSHDQDW
jgi:hypothetical protein